MTRPPRLARRLVRFFVPADTRDSVDGDLAELHAASSLDVRLSLRLLIKQPGLTLTAGFGIAAAIGISTGFFAFVTANLRPTIPLDEGDRIVALENTNLAWRQPDRRSARAVVRPPRLELNGQELADAQTVIRARLAARPM